MPFQPFRLFSKKRKHRRCDRGIRVGIRVGSQIIHFASEATRWLGIWLDSTLTLAENWRRRIGKTHQAEGRLRRIVSKYGVPPAASRNLQSAIVQGTILYASELTWKGQKSVEGEYQLAISRMGKATLGTFQSTPRGIAAGESGLTPARASLNHRQARFTQRLYLLHRHGVDLWSGGCGVVSDINSWRSDGFKFNEVPEIAEAVTQNWMALLAAVLGRFSQQQDFRNGRDNCKRRLRLQITSLFSTRSSIVS